ncbi:hypothetical protein J2Z21_009647 [Streptomyces griseochromogenes]|uniref:Resolvase/invertase-type recombinase catalytic domain-containing protein n=1 Tax=Streptomyces griseochromogenes TaxID=68214 RepID=A0ABS4MAC6_9ACTN|nr:hypothetical protein [Streptomyces griseochromogenes]MBP2056628.1 hypothetical protein [Streptomyces griseochromogenes]
MADRIYLRHSTDKETDARQRSRGSLLLGSKGARRCAITRPG